MEQIKIIKKTALKDKPEQEAVWNAIAKPWGTYVVKDIPFVVEFLKGKKGKVIDIGCGTGRNMIASSKLKYWGVDFSQGQIDKAMKDTKNKKIKSKFYKTSAADLDNRTFKDKMFDYGLFIATLHCIEKKKDREQSLKEFYRVLKKDGEGLISVWNSEDKRFKSVGNKGDIYMAWRENKVPYMRYYYLYSKREFLNLVKKVGFKVIDFYEPREHDRFSKKNWIIKVKK